MSYPDVMVLFKLCGILCTLNLLYNSLLQCAFPVTIHDKVCTTAVIYNSVTQIEVWICGKDQPKDLLFKCRQRGAVNTFSKEGKVKTESKK